MIEIKHFVYVWY